MAAEHIPSGDIVIRLLERGDTPALLEFWNRAAPFDRCSKALLDTKLWDDPGPALGLVGTAPGRINGLVMAVLRSEDSTTTNGVIKLLAVDPARRRRGLGSQLLGAAERWLAGAGAGRVRIAESAPDYLAPGIDLRYESADAFFQRHGYRDIGRACNMRVALAGRSFDTTAAEADLHRAGITVRRARVTDTPALDHLLAQFGGSWQQEVAQSMRLGPPRVHLAERKGQLLGFAACEGNNAGTGVFGPMGTLPEARGLGIGQVLLYRCLADLQDLGYRDCVIPWVGPVAFYERHCGATIDREFRRLEKEITG